MAVARTLICTTHHFVEGDSLWRGFLPILTRAHPSGLFGGLSPLLEVGPLLYAFSAFLLLLGQMRKEMSSSKGGVFFL